MIYEMENNLKNTQGYIEFLDDNMILDYNINIFNYVAYCNKIDLAELCMNANIKF